MICLLVMNGVIRASGPDASLPQNLLIDPSLKPTLIRMWDRSPTFRRQCLRIAQAKTLTLVLRQTEPGLRHMRGVTTALRDPQSGVLTRAETGVTYSANFREIVEVVAHEFEHTIELLDGIDLAMSAQRASAGFEETGRGIFETTRAVQIGRRVAREVFWNPPSAPHVTMETVAKGTGVAGSPGTTSEWMTVRQALAGDSGAALGIRDPAAVSADGRFVAFASRARLLPADTNDKADVYVFDREQSILTLESVTADGSPPHGDSVHPSLSRDGRFVLFESVAPNLVRDSTTEDVRSLSARSPPG